MNTQLSPREIVKEEAYGLAHELLVRKGFKLSRSHSLNAVALACGFENWNVLSAICYRGIEFGAVVVSERHAERLGSYLVERHSVNVSTSECESILRKIAEDFTVGCQLFRTAVTIKTPHF